MFSNDDLNKNIKNIINELLKYDLTNEIIMPNGKKEFQLKDNGVDLKLQYLIDNLRDFKDDDFSFLDLASNLQNLNNTLHELERIFFELKNFNPVQNNALDFKLQKNNRLIILFEDLNKNLIGPFMPLILRKKYSFKKIDDLYTKINVKKQEIDNLNISSKENASAVVSSKHAKIFGDESNFYKKQSVYYAKWFYSLSAGFIFIIMGLIILSLYLIDKYPNLTYSIILSKVVILSILITILYQIRKNYNSFTHLQIINRHRSNCFDSYLALKESGYDEKTKNEILIMAAKAIFDTGETGFVSHKGKDKDPISLVNIVDGLKNK